MFVPVTVRVTDWLSMRQSVLRDGSTRSRCEYGTSILIGLVCRSSINRDVPKHLVHEEPAHNLHNMHYAKSLLMLLHTETAFRAV